MCIGPLAPSVPQPQAPPTVKQTPAPTVKSAAPPPEFVEPEKIKEEVGEDEVLDTKKKKALEIKKVKEGVKEKDTGGNPKEGKEWVAREKKEAKE